MARAAFSCQRLAAALVLCGAFGAGGAQAQNGQWTTVGDHMLDQMRGGFDLGGGITVAFGISRVVTVNGVLVATTSFHIPDVGRITPMQAAAFDRQVAGMNLVQNGPRNSAAIDAPLAAGATLVQNSLDNQTIQTRTLIDTTTNGMSISKGLNAGASLQDALFNSVRAR